MATLFERIAGTYDPEGSEGKIPIHIFTAMLHEFSEDRVTGPQAKAILGLTDSNVTEAQWLKTYITTYPGSARKMMRIIKDHFYLAEWPGTSANFTDEAAFWQKLDDVMTEAGGTPPTRS